MQSALESAIAELALGRELDPADELAVRAWLARHGVAAEDSATLLNQGIERLLVYRRLVRENLRDALLLALPRTAARLSSLFDEYFAQFLARRAPRTHYLRDVTREFIEYCTPLWPRDARIAAYMLDLALHESLRIEIGAQQTGSIRFELPGLELDRGVCFIEAMRLMRYDYAVHELSDDEADRSVPPKRRTALLVYRSPEHEVRYLELTELASEILGLLKDGKTLREALTLACANHGVALDDAVLSGTAQVLADLAERGALLGAVSSPPDRSLAMVR